MAPINEITTRRLKALVLTGFAIIGFPAARAGIQEDVGIRVPPNTVFKLELLSSISTANNEKGDQFNCLVIEPPEFKDATVEGQITKLKSGRRAGKTSEIALAFKSITMNGRTGRFNAQIQEVYEVVGANKQGQADEEGIVKGRSVRKRALKIAVASAVGAVVGGLLGGGRGAEIGAAIGAALGTATSISEKSPNMELSQGTLLDVKTAGR
jgi:outer membrane lipoprotein SlyB